MFLPFMVRTSPLSDHDNIYGHRNLNDTERSPLKFLRTENL